MKSGRNNPETKKNILLMESLHDSSQLVELEARMRLDMYATYYSSTDDLTASVHDETCNYSLQLQNNKNTNDQQQQQQQQTQQQHFCTCVPAPSTAPPSPGLSLVGSVSSPSRRSQLDGNGTSASTMCDEALVSGSTTYEDDTRETLTGRTGNYRLCAAAASCFVRQFQMNGVGRGSSDKQSPATALQVQAQSLVFLPLCALVDGGFCSRDTLTFALVIAKRLAASGFAISWANCRRVLLCVIMLAGKIHADEYYTFSTLAACIGIPVTTNTMSSLAQCEWKICVALDFVLQCSLDEYNAVVEDAFPAELELVLAEDE